MDAVDWDRSNGRWRRPAAHGGDQAIIEQRQVADVEAKYEVDTTCTPAPERGEGCNDHYEAWWQDEVAPERVFNRNLAIAGGGFAVVGVGFLLAHFMVGSTKTAVAPVLTPDGDIGAALQIRF